jgi:fibronectin type 3 domain-containing protein
MVLLKVGRGGFRSWESIIITLFTITAALHLLPSQAMAATWTDDFSGSDLNPKWEQGWIGQYGSTTPIQVRPLGGIYAYTYTEEGPLLDKWHGPRIRAELPAFSDFDIKAKFRCITLDSSEINRLMIRVLDTSGNVLFSFGWSVLLVTSNLPEIGLYGSTDAAIIYTTGKSVAYSNFYDKDIRLARNGGTLSFYIEGVLKHTATSPTTPAMYVEIAFLKYEDECTIDTAYHFDLRSLTISTTDASAPDAPANLAGTGGNRYVSLNWDSPANTGSLPITGYKVYRGTVAGSEIYLTTVSATSLNDTGLVNGQVYHYYVTALNEMGEGAPCPTLPVTPMAAPSAPSSVSAVAGSNAVSLSWGQPTSDGGAPVTGYRVFKSTDSIPKSHALLGPVTDYEDTAVADGQAYHYWVAAINSVGEGALSEEVIAIPGSIASLPSEPRSLEAMPGDGSVGLTWISPISSGNLPLLGYKIYRGPTEDAMVLLATLTQSQSYVDTAVSNRQAYVYHVLAFNLMGDGPASEKAWVTPMDASVPSGPLNLAIVTGNHTAALTWGAPVSDGGSPILGYRVYRGNHSGAESLVADLGNVFTYLDTGLINNKVYYYKVSAFSALGEGPAANGSATTPQSASWDDDAPPEDLVKPPSWTDNFTVTSSITTVIALLVGFVLVLIFLKSGGGGDSGEAPGKGVDDEAKDDSADKEEGDQKGGDPLPESGD